MWGKNEKNRTQSATCIALLKGAEAIADADKAGLQTAKLKVPHDRSQAVPRVGGLGEEEERARARVCGGVLYSIYVKERGRASVSD